jgi:hypothetical protein
MMWQVEAWGELGGDGVLEGWLLLELLRLLRMLVVLPMRKEVAAESAATEGGAGAAAGAAGAAAAAAAEGGWVALTQLSSAFVVASLDLTCDESLS